MTDIDCAYNYAILPTPKFEGNSIIQLPEDLIQLAFPCRHPYNGLEEIVTALWGVINAWSAPPGEKTDG